MDVCRRQDSSEALVLQVLLGWKGSEAKFKQARIRRIITRVKLANQRRHSFDYRSSIAEHR
jgi:hypothetical protein